ncbi:MAG TPA: T9SS type A sorting domain-containing protein [Ignavibacteria bacterium]|nr:hypothetical protein [Bacteroidota bacterium]HRE11253.1 T9SS type A sorting domain-containing protein [Ignavibacteria bacterium]HRF65463.1 T9SS type A sorting domain-containing protein [Ignavibacteria bacterium]HRJ04536.1 T9SS type A sorting domain-containing protein [Ignavibacteria bacterium]HRJ85357.1 T9SS type A sorting domain-containing protein [Ignavibacteria bacterium]
MNTHQPRICRKKHYAALLLMLLFLFSAGPIMSSEAENRAAGASSFAALSSEELMQAQNLSVASNTLFSFSIPKNEFVRFSVFNTSGREIAVLINENKRAGEFSADLNKANLTKGTYYYRLVVGNYKEIKRLNIIK